MKNFDLRKYLAEGKLHENKEQGYTLYTTNVEYDNGKTGYMYQLVNSEDREENEIGFDQLYFDDNDNRLKMGVDFKDFDQGSYQEEEVSAEEAMKMYKSLAEGKLNEEKYTPGSGWTKDFDYDGMLRAGLKTGTHYDIKLLKKIAEDFTDVNYHREAAHLYDAIEAMEEGAMKEAGMFFGDFHSEINKTLNEDTIKERKTTPNKTKMKKSELKEMIKMALSEDARTDAEQEGYKDGFEDAKDDIEAKLKDMKVSEGDNYYEDSMDEAEEVDVEDNEKVDVDIEKDVEVDDKSVETDIEVKGSMPGEDADEIAIQSLLMKAQEEAGKLGDEKLTDQIGNTITYFTRAHVATVDEDVNEETDYDNTDAVSGDINVTNDNPAADAEIGLALNEEVSRFKKLAGIIK